MSAGKVLLTGGSGQLGAALLRSVPAGYDVAAPLRTALDLANPAALAAAIEGVRPDLVINAAAYTAVDAAESHPDLAYLINAKAAAALAQLCGQTGARLIHVSTDFVFDGKSGVPYRPSDAVNPLSVYGRSKRDGETAIAAALAPEQFAIIRTAWLHAPGHSNFAATMLRLLKERGHVNVVSDQTGTPTSAENLAAAVWKAAEVSASGIFHMTDAGVASWYDFAMAIARLAKSSGQLSGGASVSPISTADYKTAAVRPAFSVLDKSKTWSELGIAPEHWQDALARTWFGGKA